MSFDSLAKQLKLASEIQEAQFTAEIIKTRIDKDRYGRDVIKLWIKMDDTEDVYVLSLPPSLVREFARKALDYGFKNIDEIIGTKWFFKKVNPSDYTGGRFQGYDRFIPVSFICTEEWLEENYGDRKELTEAEIADLKRRCHGDTLYIWLQKNFVTRKEKGALIYTRK